MFTPFLVHWYVGVVPPLVGVAVKVTDAPAQTAPAGLGAIVTDGVTLLVTVMVMFVELTLEGDGHAALELSVHEK